VSFAVSTSATTVLSTLDPSEMVPRRVATMLHVAGADLLNSTVSGVAITAAYDRILVGPELPYPMYEYVARQGSGRFLPGADEIPPNAITLLETNPQFIESFMVGVNHEMSRELLWRRYPGEPRATVFRNFWDWFDGKPDIEPIHTWRAGSSLGRNSRGTGQGGQLVLLIRGDLLRRYPNTVVYAWRAEDGKLKDPYDPAVDIVRPVFAGRFDPDFSFVGFPLTDLDIERDDWFFVLQEQPTEPRFGFDELTGDATAGAALTTWLDATWSQTQTLPGQHLTITGNTLEGRTLGGVRFVRDAAHLAALSLQKPVRVAVLSDHLVGEV
jgi:hypothetical protein